MSKQRKSQRNPIPHSVLILDFDETIALPEKNADGKYLSQEDGSINATILDKEKLQHLLTLAIQHDVPIHIVTARADVPNNRSIIENIITSINGFGAGIGGFKKEHIHFVSIFNNKKWQQILTKEEKIEQIRNNLYPHLSRNAFVFSDDMDAYLAGVSKAGYKTIKANPLTKEHFGLINSFILSAGAKQQYIDRAKTYLESRWYSDWLIQSGLGSIVWFFSPLQWSKITLTLAFLKTLESGVEANVEASYTELKAQINQSIVLYKQQGFFSNHEPEKNNDHLLNDGKWFEAFQA